VEKVLPDLAIIDYGNEATTPEEKESNMQGSQQINDSYREFTQPQTIKADDSGYQFAVLDLSK